MKRQVSFIKDDSIDNKSSLAGKMPELLAPAGDLQKLETALAFGADAVYFGLPDFSLRARVNKFNKTDIRTGAKICRQQGKKFYITVNIYAHNQHLKQLPVHLKFINEIQPDAVILSDPGVFRVVKRKCPKIPIHLSTQANAINVEAVKFWQEQGVERVILAREVTLGEVKEIKRAVPEMELELFVHGAMCMAYSGRCILSKWMTGRSANLGDCAQPCRWSHGKVQKQTAKAQSKSKKENLKTESEEAEVKNSPSLSGATEEISVVDDQKRFEMNLEEDKSGTYFFNSYDLCLIEYLDQLVEAGVDSLKIEGRGKSAYYLAVATRAYRKVLAAIESGQRKAELTAIMKEQKVELEKLSHRGFWTGFLLGDEPPHLTDQAYLPTRWEFVGICLDEKRADQEKSDKVDRKRKVFVHNQLGKGDIVEAVTPPRNQLTKIIKIVNSKGEELEKAHGGQAEIFTIEFNKPIKGKFLLRRKL